MSNEQENIYGIRAIFEALENDAPVKEIFVGNYINLNQNDSIEKILRHAKSQNITVKKVDKNVLDQETNKAAHQGIMANLDPFKYTDLSEIISTTHDKSKSLIVILDHVEDSGNLGAIARSAEAFGADGLVIANKRAATISASTYKTSAGAIFNLPVAKVANINSAIEQLKKAEFWVASASEHSKDEIWSTNLKGKLALVMGSEHDGVSQLVLKNSDFIVRLPLSGKIESLNVAQAATACMYEWVRQNA